MFERFTDEVKQTVVRAQELCIARGDAMVGSEHLMLAAAEMSNPLLVDAGLRSDRVADAWDRLEADALAAVGVDDALSPSWTSRWRRRRRHIQYAGSARDTLRGALQEAVDRGERRIGLEHLALALTVRPPQDRAVRILSRAGVSSSGLRTSLLDQLRRAS